MKKAMKYIYLLSITIIGLVSCSNEEFNPSATIKLYTRDTTAGTRDGFFTGIWLSDAKDNNGPLKIVGLGIVETNGDMINSIKNDQYGIGYISLSSLGRSKVKGLNFEGVEPTEENVLNGTYTLTRNFNYIVRTEYKKVEKDQIIKAFLAYLGTQEGKAAILSKGGIVDIKSTDPTWESIKSNYDIASNDNSSITINLGGSTSVANIVKALTAEFSNLCGNVKFSHNYYGSSDAYKKTQGQDKNSIGYYDMAFASREFKLDSSEIAEEGTYGVMCIDAIVPVVNLNNPLTSVTKTQLVKMYTGLVTKWNEVF